MRRRMYAVVAATAVAAVVGAGTPAWAGAVGSVLTSGGMLCDSAGKKLGCSVNLRSGTAPYTIRWTINGTPVPDFNDQGSIVTVCTPNALYRVTASVTDATGASLSLSGGARCVANFP